MLRCISKFRGFHFASFIALIVLIASIDFAHARDFHLVKGKQEKVCQHVLQRLNAAEAHKEELLFYLPKLFPKPELQEGYYYFKNENEKGKAKRPVGFAELDIDNDGNDETLVFPSGSVSLRGQDGEQLFVFKKGEVDFLKNSPEFTYEQYINIKGIRSFIPWPYANHNLFLVRIGFITFDKVNYIAIWDVWFPDSVMARALIIANYINSPLQKIDKNQWTTDKLDVVCKIM